MKEAELSERKYDKARHAKRLETILSKWDKICDIIREEIPTENQITSLMQKINIPLTPSGLGIDCDVRKAFKATKDVRDKYGLSRLLWDLGELDGFADNI